MPRKVKPPGYEKWTWREIDAGYKMSKSEKRMRRTMVALGAKEKPGGKIEHSPDSAQFAVVIVIAMIVVAIIAAMIDCSR